MGIDETSNWALSVRENKEGFIVPFRKGGEASCLLSDEMNFPLFDFTCHAKEGEAGIVQKKEALLVYLFQGETHLVVYL